jgi:hypothetical protein
MKVFNLAKEEKNCAFNDGKTFGEQPHLENLNIP